MVVLDVVHAKEIKFSELQLSVMRENFLETKRLAKEFLKQDNNPKEQQEANYYLGLSELRLGYYDKSKQLFEDLVDDKKISDELYDKSMLGLFDSLYLSEKYDEALKVIKELYKKRHMSEFLSLIYLKMARVHLKLSHWEEARKHLNTIVNNFSNSVEYFSAKQLLEEKQYFTVQVGSFLDVERAKVLAQKLKNQGEYAYIVETKSRDDKTFYRVRVGQLSTLTEAQTLQDKLADLGYPTLIYP